MASVPQSDIRRRSETSASEPSTRLSARWLALVGAAWLNLVGLGLWFGAMIGIGAIVAPAAFQLAREQAGIILGESFRRLNYLGLGCAALVALATVIEGLAGRFSRASLARLALVAAAAGIAWHLGWQLIPEMEALRAAGRTAEFDALHHRYEQLGHAQFWLLLGAALATAIRGVPARNA